MATKRGVVTPARGGVETIQLLRKRDSAIAILELQMRHLDGIETPNIFRKIVPDTPVIMRTGEDSEKTAREGLTYGASDYLTKPCELEQLLVKIESACRGGGGQVE